MLLFGFQVEDAAKPGGQESVKNQEVSSESFTGDYWRQTRQRTFLCVLNFYLFNATSVLLSFHCSGLPLGCSFLTCPVMTTLARSDR